ncbi:MAG: hypothetical protein AAFY17_11505 [Cyanobacteria bacterium J06642_11]
MKAWIGKALMGIAIGHSITGFLSYRSALNTILKADSRLGLLLIVMVLNTPAFKIVLRAER